MINLGQTGSAAGKDILKRMHCMKRVGICGALVDAEVFPIGAFGLEYFLPQAGNFLL
ncbi:hypothetical protein LJC46_09725 [Desulfovibrio sp. OttesenSCG-928-G15]|nr:hypothetical protein [Desulfovibrio sp. OttesenSCG-928-G15]